MCLVGVKSDASERREHSKPRQSHATVFVYVWKRQENTGEVWLDTTQPLSLTFDNQNGVIYIYGHGIFCSFSMPLSRGM